MPQPIGNGIANSYKLFNKYVNLAIYSNGPSAHAGSNSPLNTSTPILSIKAPNVPVSLLTSIPQAPTMNRKPDIQVTGTFINEVGVPGLSIRVTNLYTPIPIWTYVDHRMAVEVGYTSDPRLTCTFSGKIMTAGEEKPGPDSITVFQLYLGEYDFFNTAYISGNAPAGSTVDTVVQLLLSKLNSIPSSAFNYQVMYNPSNSAGAIPLSDKGPKGTDFSGTIKTVLQELKNTYNLTVFINGESIRILKNGDYFMNDIFNLDYVTSLSRNASSYVIKAPWIPALRPCDIIYVDPKIFKQSLGGSESPPSTNQKVMTVDFDFASVGKTNTMTLFTVNPGDQ
jgi:hypothetical protein